MTILRPASLDDAVQLAPFAADAFTAAFGHLYAPEDLASFLEQERSVSRYRDKLSNPDIAVQLAEDDGTLQAYCLIERRHSFAERPEPRPRNPTYLSQLYCAAGMSGKGIGKSLFDWSIDQARRWGADAVQLSVFSENHGAQRFYKRHGFEHVAEFGFWVGNHRDHEFIYEMRL